VQLKNFHDSGWPALGSGGLLGADGGADRVGAVVTPRPPGRGPIATRRTALAGTLGGALALAGCDAQDPSSEPSATSTPSAGQAARTATERPEDPDAALVDEVVAELDELIAFTAAASRRPGAGRRPARAFERLHRLHREALTDGDAEPPEGRFAFQGRDVVQLVTRRETAAQRQLATWAVAAESGPLARLLASMSAAIAQQLAAGTPGTAGTGAA
jgi:hypothetical protein